MFVCLFFVISQPADIEKIEKTVDEALAQAAENLAQLEHIQEVKAAPNLKQTTHNVLHDWKDDLYPNRKIFYMCVTEMLHVFLFDCADSDKRSGKTGKERAISAGEGDQASCRQSFTCYSKMVPNCHIILKYYMLL